MNDSAIRYHSYMPVNPVCFNSDSRVLLANMRSLRKVPRRFPKSKIRFSVRCRSSFVNGSGLAGWLAGVLRLFFFLLHFNHRDCLWESVSLRV